MSAGHYDYKYYQLNYLADEIESDFINDGKYMDDDYSVSTDFNYQRPQKEFDRLENASPKEKLIILMEARKLTEDLRKCSDRARILDLLLSGDISPTIYMEKLNKINFKIV